MRTGSNSLTISRTASSKACAPTPSTRRISRRRGRSAASGETTVFEDGTYTACQPCKEHPDKPPLWQMRAMRIIHKNDEQTIYFEDADLEFLGIPVAYIPYLSAPDPSVKQRSGVLAPHYYTKTALGFGLGIPIYWALAPDYDLTVTPTYLTRQGLLGSVEWRQKFVNGSYNILASGIFEQDPAAFLPPPYGSADEKSRGIDPVERRVPDQ